MKRLYGGCLPEKKTSTSCIIWRVSKALSTPRGRHSTTKHWGIYFVHGRGLRDRRIAEFSFLNLSSKISNLLKGVLVLLGNRRKIYECRSMSLSQGDQLILDGKVVSGWRAGTGSTRGIDFGTPAVQGLEATFRQLDLTNHVTKPNAIFVGFLPLSLPGFHLLLQFFNLPLSVFEISPPTSTVLAKSL
jgi:hypothetical protein